jgi:ElaB/YqjD/DUF883 family membrane-anchored ribosome-binding protein
MTNNPKPSAEELRKKVADAYGSGRAKAETAVRTVKQSSLKAARTAKKSTSDGLENNPVAALVGGLAIGAIVAALLPGTKRESELLGKTGKRIRNTAANAAKAARDVGKEQLDTLGLNSGAAREQLRGVVDKIGQAASAASKAATDAVRQKP